MRVVRLEGVGRVVEKVRRVLEEIRRVLEEIGGRVFEFVLRNVGKEQVETALGFQDHHGTISSHFHVVGSVAVSVVYWIPFSVAYSCWGMFVLLVLCFYFRNISYFLRFVETVF